MSGSPESAHFNYINLLGKLEEACRAHKPRLPDVRAGVERAIDNPLHFARLAGAKAQSVVKHILARAAGQPDMLKSLSIEADRLAKLERILLRNIHNYTTGRTSADRSLEDIWPSPIPEGRVLERLIATTLGLASERRQAGSPEPEANFQLALRTAVRSVLLPALAWRILCELHTYHETTREELLARLVANLKEHAGIQHDASRILVDGREYRIHSLVLHRAWFDVLTGPACKVPHADAVAMLCRELTVLLGKSDSNLARNNLFPLLTQAFGWGLYGSERSHAIELAWKQRQQARGAEGKAVFASARLRLLDAAHSGKVSRFAELARVDLHAANEEADTAVAKSQAKPLEVEHYAGMAYWLAHACFRRPMAYSFSPEGQHRPVDRLRRDGELVDIAGGAPTTRTEDYDKASERAARLLEHAIGLDAAIDDQRLTMRRFLAGFATNPRYWRGPYVMAQAPRWVDAYEQAGGRPSLVHQFRGRLAWHQAQLAVRRERDDRIAQALDQYRRCFEVAGVDLHDLDSEAPLHLFPEVAVLVETQAGKRLYNVLETIDFILSRNFSIYMDVESEKASILAGLSQFAAQPARPAPQPAR